MRRLRDKLTYANVMATIAVFIALGGASYAATQLPKNSVGTKQLKNAAVTPAKLSATSKSTLTGATGPQGPQGQPGASGSQGPAGEKGATGDKGDIGPKGDKGEPGDKGDPGEPGKSVVVGTPTSGECSAGGATVQVEGSPSTKKAVCNGAPAPEVLASGTTEVGAWRASGKGSIGDAISFYPMLPSPPVGSEFLKFNETSASCPGQESATAGYLCFYAGLEMNGVEFKNILGLVPLRRGASIQLVGSQENSLVIGSWAYKAP